MSDRRRFAKWRTPRWKDPAFWAAVALWVVAVVVQALFIADRTNALAWGGLVLQAVVTWIVVSALIRIRVGMRRGLEAGFAEREEAAAKRETGRTATEDAARVAGRALGKAVGTWKRNR